MRWLYLALFLPAVAFARDLNWGTVTGSRFRADYVSPATMRLRVFSPKGATVEIRSNNELVAKGVVPFIYRPRQEGFISVSVRLPNGKQWWANSVRMKAKTECQLWVYGPPGSEGPTVAEPQGSAATPAPSTGAHPAAEGAVEPPATPGSAAPGGAMTPPPAPPAKKSTPAEDEQVVPPPAEPPAP